MRAVAFWVLSVVMSVTMTVRPALAHGVGPSLEGECHPLEPDDPEHCHDKPTEKGFLNDVGLIVGAVLVVPLFALGALFLLFRPKPGESGDTPPLPERGEPGR